MAVGDDDTIASSVPAMTGTGPAPLSEVVAGRYRIVRWLGGGGMGRVYEALDQELGERVALKVLRAGLSEDAIERFRREVKLTRRIQHRNVARMFDIGEHAGEKFLTMELVDGEPLSRVVGKPMPWPQLKSLAEQLCAGLAAAHAAGVVHRDLKPDNVLIEAATGRCVITDFGIARSIDISGDEAGVTQLGTVVGTPRYMSPEQLAGKDVDARSDLFALGVILFELASGGRPWSGDNPITIAVQQATVAPRSIDPAAAPPAFAAIVDACLAIEPQRRPATATAVATAITAESAAPLTPATRIQRPSRPSLAPIPVEAASTTAIAVLPLQCAPADAYLAEGLREDVTDTLSTTSGLRVRPTGAVTGDDPREIGQRLAVDHVVVGSLRRTSTGLRVSVRLIGVADGFQIWAHKADVVESEILTTAEQVARGVAEALSTRASTATRPTDPRAVDLYLRARAELRRFWGVHVHEAAKLLQQAADFAPSSPPILAALAFASVQAWVMKQADELQEPARIAMERALATGHGEAYLASAVYSMNLGDFEHAARDLGHALLRAPMSAHVHELAGRILVEISSASEARHHFEISVGLDQSRAKLISGDLARLDALEAKWESADARVAALVADPDPSIAQVGYVYRARLAAWRFDKTVMLESATLFAPRMGDQANRIVRFMSEAAKQEQFSAEAWYKFVEAFSEGSRPVRQQLMGLQLLVEIAATRGEAQTAIDILKIAARVGLMDVVWLDRCPLFVQLLEHPDYPAIRSQVATRAERVLAALRSVTS
jgi:TolB-like protein